MVAEVAKKTRVGMVPVIADLISVTEEEVEPYQEVILGYSDLIIEWSHHIDGKDVAKEERGIEQ